MPKKVTPNIPKKTADPTLYSISAPLPLARTRGATPKIKANEVIRIGRNLKRPGFDGGIEAGKALVLPLQGKLHDENGFLQASRQARRTDLVKMLLSMPRTQTPRWRVASTWNDQHDGQGERPLSYCAASVRKTNNTQAGR